MFVITFINGMQKRFDKEISILEVSENLERGLSKLCIAGEINGELVDVHTLVSYDCKVNIITINNNKEIALKVIRYSCMQLFSYAIKLLWPDAKMGDNQLISEGFYYDIDMKHKIQQNDLTIIEKKMRDLAHTNYNIFKKVMSCEEAQLTFQKLSESYKFLLLKGSEYNKKEKISLHYHENHVDFTKVVQLPNIRFCRFFKIQRFSGVYWLGNIHNRVLQRIYITVWSTDKQLTLYLNKLKESKKRDHRKIGKKLDLYHIQEESPGMVFWHNNGWIIFKELVAFIREKLRIFEYEEVKSPMMLDKQLWQKSGHWDNYKDSMFITFSEKYSYCIKPMNCPAHLQIFNQKLRSYKDLPIRMAEFGSCHRNEPSGSLHGLMRIRAFTQDDAHIFCTKSQIRSEINHCIKMIYDVYSIFGFKQIQVKFSSRPLNRIGDDKTWDDAEQDLIEVLKDNKLEFEYQEGQGAFYGPKIELILLDSLSRMWQCGTIQLDFYLPKRLKSFYIDKSNNRRTPVIIHRAILGSIERFIGILIEEYSGSLPLWLSPVQVTIISISDNHIEYVNLLRNRLISYGIRIKIDVRSITMSLKIKEFIVSKVPYMLICGNNEVKTSMVTVRTRNGKIFKNFDFNKFVSVLLNENNTRGFCNLEE